MVLDSHCNKNERYLTASLFFLSIFWVYVTAQHNLFSKPYTHFADLFHYVDQFIHVFLNPSVFFVSGALFSIWLSEGRKARALFFDYFVYLFLVWTIVQNLIEVVFSGYTGSSALMADIYFEFFSAPSNHLWLLIALLVNFSLLRCVVNISCRYCQLVIALASCLAYLFYKEINFVYPFFFVTKYFIFCYLGVLYQRYEVYKKCNTPFKLAGVSVFLLSMGGLFYFGDFDFYAVSFIALVLSLLGIFSVVNIVGFLDERFKSVQIIGLCAVSIYLFYYTFISGIRDVLFLTFQFSHTYIHLMLAVVFGVAIPVAIFRLRNLIFISWLYRPPKAISYAAVSRLFEFKPLRRVFYSFIIMSSMAYAGLYWQSEREVGPGSQEYPQLNDSVDVAQADSKEGQRLATVYGCYKSCHGHNLQGTVYHKVPMRIISSAPNLTRAVDTYSVKELDGIIRHGVRPDGSALVGGMPAAGYAFLTDQELGAILAFLKSYPKQGDPNVPSQLGVAARVNIVTGAFKTPQEKILMAKKKIPSLNDPELGQKIVHAACTECHGYLLQGWDEIGAPPLAIARAYDKASFFKLMRQGEMLGGRSGGLMTQVAKIRFSQLTDEEITAVHDYLISFEPVAID